MANKFKGELTLGNGMVMVMSFYALTIFEGVTGKVAMKTIKGWEGKTEDEIPMTELVAIYYACLKVKNDKITMEEAADVFTDYPEALGELMAIASPEADEVKESGNAKKATRK
ncbi:hypothetical protein [Paracoccus sp. (in: a-proteobacteria)]|uniref:hypothetical protein n=1 Tax=Paracoccus sp. TaxID=267 RepID=UPI00405A1BCF